METSSLEAKGMDPNTRYRLPNSKNYSLLTAGLDIIVGA